MFTKRNTAVYFLQGASSPSPQIPLPATDVQMCGDVLINRRVAEVDTVWVHHMGFLVD